MQQQFDQLAGDLGATSESVDQIHQDLDAAAVEVADAEQARESASGALEKTRVEVQAAKARSERTKTCLRGTVDALGAAFDTGGLEAAMEKLQPLVASRASS